MLEAIETPERSERQAQFIADVSEMAMDPGSEFIGYMAMALYSDGSLRAASWGPDREEHRIGRQLFQAWVRAGLEYHIARIEGVDACYSVLNGEA